MLLLLLLPCCCCSYCCCHHRCCRRHRCIPLACLSPRQPLLTPPLPLLMPTWLCVCLHLAPPPGHARLCPLVCVLVPTSPHVFVLVPICLLVPIFIWPSFLLVCTCLFEASVRACFHLFACSHLHLAFVPAHLCLLI